MGQPAYDLDPTVWRSDDGVTIIGGSDFTIIGLDAAQKAHLDSLLDPRALGSVDRRREHPFTDFLLRRNLVQPSVPGPADTPVALVIPCHDDEGRLRDLLGSPVVVGCRETVVVDDGSTRPLTADAVDVLRHPVNRGAASARQTGWQHTTSPLVLFVDSDVVCEEPIAARLAGFFVDPAVGAVSARVVNHREANTAGGLVSEYDDADGPLDLGGLRSNVTPMTRVPYVPTACLMVRREALESVGGFDTAMRLGEDVDLIWRLVDTGWRVRYEPSVRVGHHARSNLRDWLGQRIAYGRSTADLAVKHPGHVAALEWTGWNAAPWLAASLGGATGAGLAGASAIAGLLPLRRRRYGRAAISTRQAFDLQLLGARAGAEAFLSTLRRSWFPFAVVASLVRRRFALLTLIAVGAPSIRDWFARGPSLSLPVYVTMRLADDVGFGIGVWLQSIRRRSFRALRLHLSPLSRFIPADVPQVDER